MERTVSRRASYDLGGSVAVVTGGLKGIGELIVDALKRAAARVVIWDVAVDEDSRDVFKVDVSDMASVDRAASRTIEAEGRIDILVNNAGIAGSTHPVEAYDPMEWRRILDVNLTGTFNVCRRLVPAMKANGWGRIVNISSLAGKEGTPNSAAYSASKAGIIALTKALGKELANTGVLVNAIALPPSAPNCWIKCRRSMWRRCSRRVRWGASASLRRSRS